MRGIRSLASRKMYIFAMVAVPLGVTLFFLTLMGEGLPLRTPVGIVDLDHSQMSRQVTRALNAGELLEIRHDYESYGDAMEAVRRGDIFGFFVIPHDFQRDAIGGDTPTLSFCTNMTYFVPGTLSFKGFKTVAVTTAGSVVKTTLVGTGMADDTAQSLLQPVVPQVNPIGNPWTNYNIYLTNSFMPALLQLMIMLVTIYSISFEIKEGTSVEWLADARGSIIRALLGKLLPQTAVFLAVGMGILGMLFGFAHFPLHGSVWAMALAMALLVVASQAMGLFFVSILPNPRLALSVASLTGILTFSIAAFSFPVESMYGPVAIFSYILPVRYYFLIYVNEALNGVALYYSRYYFAALLVFPLVASTMLWRLKRACMKPVYVP